MILYLWRYIQPEGSYSANPPYYEPYKAVDSFTEVVWCEDFYIPGSFVLSMRSTPEMFNFFKNNNVLITRQETQTAMIPNRIEIVTQEDGTNKMTVYGESAESILNGRVIKQSFSWSSSRGTAEEAIEYYAKNNMLGSEYYENPGSKNIGRFIPFLQYKIPASRKSKFPENVSISPYLEPLGDTISAICQACGFGYRLIFDPDTRTMILSVVRGEDRTINQLKNSPVVFSNEFNTLGASELIISKERQNSILITESGNEYINDVKNTTGMNRKEAKVYDKRTAISDNSNGVSFREEVSFSGEVLPNAQFKFRKDYYLGDKVTVKNSLGIQGTTTVTEVVESENQNGYKVIPKLSDWEGAV